MHFMHHLTRVFSCGRIWSGDLIRISGGKWSTGILALQLLPRHQMDAFLQQGNTDFVVHFNQVAADDMGR